MPGTMLVLSEYLLLISLFLADGLGSGDLGSGDFQMGKLLRGSPEQACWFAEASSLGPRTQGPCGGGPLPAEWQLCELIGKC